MFIMEDLKGFKIRRLFLLYLNRNFSVLQHSFRVRMFRLRSMKVTVSGMLCCPVRGISFTSRIWGLYPELFIVDIYQPVSGWLRRYQKWRQNWERRSGITSVQDKNVVNSSPKKNPSDSETIGGISHIKPKALKIVWKWTPGFAYLGALLSKESPRELRLHPCTVSHFQFDKWIENYMLKWVKMVRRNFEHRNEWNNLHWSSEKLFPDVGRCFFSDYKVLLGS